MADLKKVLGQRIESARKRLNLTQQQLAEEIDFLSHQILSQIETGQRDVKAWELARIARVLYVDIYDLLKDDDFIVSNKVYWRKKPVTNRERIEAAFIKYANDYASIERLCNMPNAEELPQLELSDSDLNVRRIRKYGDLIRQQFDLGHKPACYLSKVLEDSYGVKFLYKNLGEEGSGASSIGEFGVGILINSSEVIGRRHFSIAHELFHLITWNDAKLRTEDTEFSDKAEKLAESFASSLLLPKESLIDSLEKRGINNELSNIDLISIAQEYEVSSVALLWRICNLGWMNSDEVHKVLEDKEYQQLNRDHKTEDEGDELPQRYLTLCYTCYQSGRISRAKVAEYLGVSLVDLPERLKEYGFADEPTKTSPVYTLRR